MARDCSAVTSPPRRRNQQAATTGAWYLWGVLPALVTGFGFGFLVAAQVGPIWLLCARTSVRFGARAGMAVGAGAAVVDLVYASLGVAGAGRVLAVSSLRLAFGLLGAAVLTVIGVRTVWAAARVRMGGETDDEVVRPREAFRTAVVATASNPLTVASWAALFAAASVASLTRSGTASAALVAGVGIGSMTLFTVLAVVAGLARRRLGTQTIRVVDGLSGIGLVGFGGLLGVRALHRG